MKRRLILLSFLIFCSGLFCPRWGGATSGLRVTDVNTYAFSLVWLANQAASCSVNVYADAEGQEPITGLTITDESVDHPPAAQNGVMKVTVSGLTPETTYYYQIVTTSDEGTLVEPSSGPFPTGVKTEVSSTTPNNDVLAHRILRSDGLTPALGALLLVKVEGGDYPITGWVGDYDPGPPWAQVNLMNIYSATLHTSLELFGGEAITVESIGGLMGFRRLTATVPERTGEIQTLFPVPDDDQCTLVTTGPITVSDELVLNYGATYGLWHYDLGRGWTQLNTVNPEQMLAADVDDDGMEEVVASFSGYGLYVYKEATGWTQLNSVIPDNMIRLGNALVANYGATYGLWHYDQVRGWTQLNTVTPDQMLAVDMDNDGTEEVVASFSGYGLYLYKETTGWTQLNSVIPDAMMRFSQGLVANFGAAYGLWHYDQVGGWRQLNTVNPEQMIAVDVDHDGVEEVIASFSGYGLYLYKETNGWMLLNSVIPDIIIGANLIN
jgi:hypothetical protein